MVFVKGMWLKILLALVGIFILSNMSSAVEIKAANASLKAYHGKSNVLKKLKNVFSVGFQSKSKTSKMHSATQSKKNNFLLSKSASMASPLTKASISDNTPTSKKINSGCYNGTLNHGKS